MVPLVDFLPFCKGLSRCARTLGALQLVRALLCKGGGSARCCCAAQKKLVQLKLWQTQRNVRNAPLFNLKYMLLANCPDVWRGRRKRKRGESACLRVSLAATVRLSSPRISYPSAAPRPLFLRFSAAGGYRPAVPRLSGVSSPVYREPGTRGVPPSHTAKVTPAHRGHKLSVSLPTGLAARLLRWPVPQMERTRRVQGWALSAPRTEAPADPGALRLREPPLCGAHRHRVQLRKPANVSPSFNPQV